MRFLGIATTVLVTSVAGIAFHATPSAVGQAPAACVREVNVVAERYEFHPDRIEVAQGDHVKITVRSADGTHGFAIKGLGIRAQVPRGGDPITVEFDARKPGSFEIACFEYCGTGHRQMKATLVVTPRSGDAGRD